MKTALTAALFAACVSCSAHAQWLQVLSAPPGADGNPTVDGISADGTVAFGRSLSDCDPTPIRWLRAGGSITPESLGFANGLPRASSRNGWFFAGDTNCDSNPNALTWRWNPISGLEALSVLPIESFTFTQILGMSGDGSVVAGYGLPDFTSEPEVAVRVGTGPLIRISVVPTDGPMVSDDGSTVVFLGRPPANPFTRVLYRWTVPNGPLVAAATLPITADLLGVSNDGSAAYFQPSFGGPLQRHKMSDGVVTLSNTCCPSLATDVTPDGSVVVGLTLRGTQSVAYVWDAANGVRHLDTLLTSMGVNLNGATLTAAAGVSEDGTVIVGAGTPGPWLVDLDFVPPPVCDPDVNQDGNVDQDDVAYLVNVIGGGENPTGIDPDFNQDGNVDQDDASSLINTVGGGGCP